MEASAAARVGRIPTHAVQDVFLRSVLLPPSHVTSTLVTMNARVLLENRGSKDPYEVTLSYPAQADPAFARVSVLSPLGSSLLGLSVGDTASWRAFGRERAARILAIHSHVEFAGPTDGPQREHTLTESFP